MNKLVFTGSIATGKKIMSSAASTLKPLTLELGGNDPAILLPDVDPENFAQGLFWGSIINYGQTCGAIKRLYVHDSLFDRTAKHWWTSAARFPWVTAWMSQTCSGRCRTSCSSGG